MNKIDIVLTASVIFFITAEIWLLSGGGLGVAGLYADKSLSAAEVKYAAEDYETALLSGQSGIKGSGVSGLSVAIQQTAFRDSVYFITVGCLTIFW